MPLSDQILLAQIFLVLCGGGAMALAARANLTAALLWTVSIGLFTLAALLSLLANLGLDITRPYANSLELQSESLGALAFVGAAFFSLIYAPSKRTALWLTAFAVGILLAVAMGLLPRSAWGFAPTLWIAGAAIAAMAFWAILRGNRRAGAWALAALLCGLLAELMLGELGGQLPMQSLGAVTLSLGFRGLMLLSLGLTARAGR